MITTILYGVIGAVALLAVAVVFLTLMAFFRPRPRSPSQAEDWEAERERRALEGRDRLSHTWFGPVLAGEVWDALMARPPEPSHGVLVEGHRDFCGQGLVRTEAGVVLCDVQDWDSPGPPIATWTDRAAFVTFFAGQSDFSCSGWDPAEPVFFSDDPWYRNNQRLTRAVFERFLRATPTASAADDLSA